MAETGGGRWFCHECSANVTVSDINEPVCSQCSGSFLEHFPLHEDPVYMPEPAVRGPTPAILSPVSHPHPLRPPPPPL
jgi:hypothetical protein